MLAAMGMLSKGCAIFSSRMPHCAAITLAAGCATLSLSRVAPNLVGTCAALFVNSQPGTCWPALSVCSVNSAMLGDTGSSLHLAYSLGMPHTPILGPSLPRSRLPSILLSPFLE
eukprot:3073556-Rhodomonas_salina.3